MVNHGPEDLRVRHQPGMRSTNRDVHVCTKKFVIQKYFTYLMSGHK